MDEEQILQCQVAEKLWKCPIEECSQLLSRKQTLKNHLFNQHNIQAGHPSKRYKLYETNDTLPIPRRTVYRKQLSLRNPQVDEPATSASQDEMLLISDIPSFLDFEPKDQYQDTEFNIESDSVIAKDDFVEQPMELIDISSDEDSSEEGIDGNSQSLPRPETEVNSKYDPPLYVLPPSESLYRCPIPQSEYFLAASALSSRYNMSATMIRDVLAFSQLGMPEHNLCATSLNHLQQSCGFDADYLKYHLYCECCKKLFDMASDLGNCKTPGCIGSKTENQKYFVTGNLNVQFREILERGNMWESIEETRQSSLGRVSLSDITFGLSYKKLQEPGGFLDGTPNITLSLFIDGIPLYKSSSVSLWPVYLLINEIPPQKRFRRKNMLLWGVLQGVGKPSMNMFLRPFIVDLISLYTKGVSISISMDNQTKEINVKAMLVVATMDLQARAYFTNMTQQNGDHGCLYCMESGQIVPSGKAHCRAYLKRDEPPSCRTDEMARSSAIKARQTGSRTDGFIGESVLWYLPYFSMESQKSIHRLPRILSNTYHHWKASELRNWLLFYSIPCLLEFLPSVYLTHFSCLAEVTYLLLSEGLLVEDVKRADFLLQSFVSTVQNLYGDNAMSLNLHNLTHLAHFVKQWGPLWAWSCFAFESFNGEIKRSVHGTGNVCKQIFWALQAQKRVEMRAPLATSKRVQDFLKVLMEPHSENFPSDSEAFQCSVVRSSKVLVTLQQKVKACLQILANTDKDSDYISVTKIARNGFQMYSKNDTRGKKQNSYTIKLEKPKEGNSDIIEVASYVMEKNSRRVFAIGQLMKSSGSILHQRIPHLQKIECVGSCNQVVAAENLREPMVVIKAKNFVIAAVFPNNFERD